MGLYNIERQILFNSEEHQLTHIASSESVTLSLIASQILSLLIERQGHVVERETIFTSIFDPYGATSTGNNLNQYILNLRKQLRRHGVELEVIQTVPKIGFMIPAAIEITKINGELSLSVPNAEQFSDAVSAKRMPPVFTHIWITLMLMVVALCAFVYWRDSTNSVKWGRPPLAKLIPIHQEKLCQINLIPSGIGFNNDDEIDYQNVVKHFNDVECVKNVSTRYYLYSSATRTHKYRFFILKCTGDPAGPSCVSSYMSVEQ